LLKVSIMYDEIDDRRELLGQHLWQYGQKLSDRNKNYRQLLLTAQRMLCPTAVSIEVSVEAL
jgi:hypothetical protein